MLLSRYTILAIFGILLPLSGVFAQTSKESESSKAPIRGVDHPPHDHQQHDHIKKLDEGMQRRKKKIS